MSAPSSPTCGHCGTEMERIGSGTAKSVPLLGSEVEYRRYSCPECGQAARFERERDDEEWKRAGT